MIAAVFRENRHFSKHRCFNYKSVFEFDVLIILKSNTDSSF
jgi:hypothetical protein